MQTKRRFIFCFLLVAAALCFVFMDPSFAADALDEEEMAKAYTTVTGEPVSVVTATNAEKTVERNSTDAATSTSSAAANEKTSSDLLYSLFALGKENITVTLDNQEIDYSGSLERTLSGKNVLTGSGMGIFYTENVRATTTGSYTVNTRF